MLALAETLPAPLKTAAETATALSRHALETLRRAGGHASGLGESAAAAFAALPADQAALADMPLRAARLTAQAGGAAIDVAHFWLFGDGGLAQAMARLTAAARAEVAAEAAYVEGLAAVDAYAAEAPDADAPAYAGPPLYDAAPEAADNLLALRGVGPKIAGVLNALGVHTYAQIAAWGPDDVAWVEAKLDFPGRVTRDGWVAQAQALASA